MDFPNGEPTVQRRRWLLWVAAALAAVAFLLGGVAIGVNWQKNRSGTGSPADRPGDDTAGTTTTASLTVQVTVPEGYTVLQIAELLENSDVCSKEAFLQAVQEGDFSDYSFVGAIPMTDSAGEPNGRVYRLEGYLFPDTYEFYRQCSAEAAVRRFLDNFARKAQALEPLLNTVDLTLDEVVTCASVIQWEAAQDEDMPRISRVLWNRLTHVGYPRLQCDVTQRYCRQLEQAGVSVDTAVYDTYVCRGLPVGAINNPGLAALKAAVLPSEEDICRDCYYFFADMDSQTVYYSKTYEEHQQRYDQLLKEKRSEN